MSETPDAVARRGDHVVICLCHRDWKTGEPLEDDEFWLGQVTSVTRAGLVRLYRPAGTFAGESGRRGRPDRGQPLPSPLNVLRRLHEAWNPRRSPGGRQ